MVMPNKVSPFLSRNQDMFECLKMLSEDKNKVIQVFGLPGLGKSALLKNVTCFLGERDHYKDGVVYIDFLHVQTFQEAIQIMAAYLKDIEEQEQFYQSFGDQEVDMLQSFEERLKDKISRHALKRMLFSLDYIDHMNDSNMEKFLDFISAISSKEVKVIFTSSKWSKRNF